MVLRFDALIITLVKILVFSLIVFIQTKFFIKVFSFRIFSSCFLYYFPNRLCSFYGRD